MNLLSLLKVDCQMVEFKKGDIINIHCNNYTKDDGDIIPCEIGGQNISGHMVYLKPFISGYRGKYVNAVNLKMVKILDFLDRMYYF